MHVSTPNIYVNARFTKFILNDNDLLWTFHCYIFHTSVLLIFFSGCVLRARFYSMDAGILMQTNYAIDE